MLYEFYLCLKTNVFTDDSNILAGLEVTGVEHCLIFQRPHWLRHNLKMSHTVSPFSFAPLGFNDLFFFYPISISLSLSHLCRVSTR